MPGRSFQSEAYRYGYQGSERDPEMSGGAGYTTYFRALDPRIGRWLTPDPKVFPWQSPYVSMDGNPVAMIDPWGASTGSGEYVDQKTANSGSAAKGAQYKDNTGRVFQNRGEGLGWEEITPPSATANTPSNLAFRNDATQVVNRFIPDLARQDVRRAQVDTDYGKNMTWLNKVGDFFTQFDENRNGDDLWQIYSEDDGQGQAIRAKGRPLLVDKRTLPFQMGLGRGFSGKGKINTIRFIKDLLGAAGLGANAFKNGHDTKLIDIAVEAVKGNAGADNKPSVETAKRKNLINTSSEDPVSVVCWGSNDSAGVYITRDSLSNGEIKYRKSDLNSDSEENSDSSSWFNAINNW